MKGLDKEFYDRSIEKWRQNMGLEKIVFWAHSFGGYLIGKYTNRYPKHVRKIVFVSSHGIHTWADRDSKIEKLISNCLPYLCTYAYKVLKFIPLNKISPFSILKLCGRLSKIFVYN